MFNSQLYIDREYENGILTTFSFQNLSYSTLNVICFQHGDCQSEICRSHLRAANQNQRTCMANASYEEKYDKFINLEHQKGKWRNCLSSYSSSFIIRRGCFTNHELTRRLADSSLPNYFQFNILLIDIHFFSFFKLYASPISAYAEIVLNLPQAIQQLFPPKPHS